MIRYPHLDKKASVGITAPSSGVPDELHDLLDQALGSLERKGYKTICGQTPWTQDKVRSAPAKVRAEEFHNMMDQEDIQLIFPPWGGELLIEMLAYIDFNKINNKWILGYSDTSSLLLSITLKTGIATAHGTNLIDIRGDYSDETTARWQDVLSTKAGDSVLQYSSEKFQKEWDFANPTPHIFHLTEATRWQAIPEQDVSIEGRLLGGCIDTIRHLIGTPYGDVDHFEKQFIPNDPVIWYLENCELSTIDLKRSLIQMKYAGWFNNCSGLMFGRSPANTPVNGYTIEELYQEMAETLQIPIIYDIDCGHVPPQITFINGAYAKVALHNGRGQIEQTFKA